MEESLTVYLELMMGGFMMGVCDNCGNDYDRNFSVRMNGKEFLFDCFECAIHKLAPVCAHCDPKVIGHGVEVDKVIYCCNHCANQEKSHSKPFSEYPPSQFTF